MKLLCPLIPLCLAVVLAAADLPLGHVVAVGEETIGVRFDAAARLAFGQVVALYGPGRVTKHPLTGKVVTEERRLLAKGQVVAAGDDGIWQLRLVWSSDGAQPEQGWDAVPLPGEAAPNAPPVVNGRLPAIAAAPGATVPIRLPIMDPDGDALWLSWSLQGPPGRCGVLDAVITASPENRWTAPAIAGEATLAVTATDAWGQQAQWTLPLTIAGDHDPRRQRQVFARFGSGQEPVWIKLAYNDDGSWSGVDEAGRVHRVAPGWLQVAPALPEGAAGQAIAAVQRGRDLYVLDRDKSAVLVFGDNRQLRRTLGGLGDPRDLAVAADGTVFVADQRAGGVLVFDQQGRFRARLGRLGDDSFAEVSRVCALPQGGVAVLDAKARRIHRFDDALRRLDAWSITGDPQVAPVDLAAHPRGLLLLLQDGSMQAYGPRGMVVETWKPRGVIEERPLSIASAPSGIVLVVHARGTIVRFAPDGQQLGMRGAGLTTRYRRIVVDGAGQLWGADLDERRIHAHDAQGWRIASYGGGQRQGGPFAALGAYAVQPDGTAVVAIDPDRRIVVRLDARAGAPPVMFGGSGSNLGQFKDPVAVAVDETGRCYVLDDDLYRVSVFDARGQFLFAFGERGNKPHQFDEPILIAVSPAGDAAYIFDEDRYEVKKFALDHAARQARHVGTGGGKGSEPGRFRKAVELCVDRLGYLHVFDSSRGDWQILDFRGQNLLPIAVIPLQSLHRGASGGWVNPDGVAWLLAGGSLIGVR